MKHPSSTPSPSNSSCPSEMSVWDHCKMLWWLLCLLLTATPGCQANPGPVVQMECVAVYNYDHADIAIMEDEQGNRVKISWGYSGHLPVVGDVWKVQDGELIERVK